MRFETKRYLEWHIQEPYAARNEFRQPADPDRAPLPTFAESRRLLPEPHWEGHASAIECYWKVWELAFRNLRRANETNGFPADYIDTAFNDCIFLWDSVFILQFARYGAHAFPFQRTLDCLYAKQHEDGFICREIRADGTDQWERFDPASTGPNVLAWSEWNYWLTFRDETRLRAVFPVLAAYHRWTRRFRSWPDGSYWTCGLGCGMDNQPRTGPGTDVHFDHGWASWQDTTLQALLSANLLAQMAEILDEDGREFADEHERLSAWCLRNLWNEETAFFHDRYADGSFSPTKSIAAFWSLLALDLPADRVDALCAHLEDPAEFNRFHRVPCMTADHPEFDPQGGYWRGGVWPPTNYMVLSGLDRVGRHRLAHEIGRNHHQRVVEVFESTGTVWENYAPENNAPAQPAKADFVGWGGLGPVAVLFEHVFGLRPDPLERKLVWDVRLTEAHGVERYPFLKEGLLDLRCEARSSESEEPRVTVRANVPISVEVRWSGGTREVAAHLE